MKRFITVALMIIVCFIFQSTIFQSLSIASIVPNLLLVLTSSMGFMRGKKEGMLIGLISGFLLDISFGNLLGFNALVYMYIGYLNGFFNHIFYPEDIKLPMILITASDFIYGLLIYGFMFLLRGRINFFYYLRRIILPEVIYTVVVTVFLYRLILFINKKLESPKKRSKPSLVE